MILPSTAAANGGMCVPCKRGFRKDIEEGKLRYEERKRAQANPDPATKHWRWLVGQVYRSPGGFAGLSEENRTYFAVCLLEGEIYNGGFHQYFLNSSGDHYAVALHGLEEVGAAACRRLLLDAKQVVFGQHEVPGTKAARFDYLDLKPAQERKLSGLDRSFGNEAAKLRELLAQYAQRHCLFQRDI
ncbi:MAG: DUF4375 domain-containing protein [Alphaproteobacteria bacterium]|nr:DUF4375 domain-containing protein [Alphaproteobacteria bacterium]